MARASSQSRERRSFLTTFGFNDVLNVSGIAGLVAVMIAVTLCYIVIKHPDTKIPDILSNALTVILDVQSWKVMVWNAKMCHHQKTYGTNITRLRPHNGGGASGDPT